MHITNFKKQINFFLFFCYQNTVNDTMIFNKKKFFFKHIQGAQKIALPYTQQQKLTVKQLLTHFSSMDTSKAPKELFSADIQKDLLLLEEQEGSVNFKFGVVYMKCGQKCDDEMLSNGMYFCKSIFYIGKKKKKINK